MVRRDRNPRGCLGVVTIELAAGGWGVLMSLAPLIQMRRMIATRSSADVSRLFLLVLQIGFVLFLAYGLSIENRLLIVTNAVSIIANGSTLAVALAFRNPFAEPFREVTSIASRAPGRCGCLQR